MQSFSVILDSSSISTMKAKKDLIGWKYQNERIIDKGIAYPHVFLLIAYETKS